MKTVSLPKYFFILLSLIVCGILNAQTGKMPPFRMVTSDGKIFLAQYLPMGKSIVIIYFSADCEECQKLTSSLISRIDEFRKVSITMITYQPRETMRSYVEKNNLAKYDNIYAGTEYPTLYVRDYFNIMHFPFMVLYDKNGNLIKKYPSKEISLDDLGTRIKMLN